jgi:hypothetical protein
MSEADASYEKIQETVLQYFDGMMYGDGDKLRCAFHADAFIIGHYDGELSWMSRDEFADFCKTESTLTEGEPYEARIESIDISGDTAVAKVVNRELGVWYTDYLSLLALNNSHWQIVNKIYFAHPPQ